MGAYQCRQNNWNQWLTRRVLHLTFQEYLAAYYLSKLPVEEQNRVIDKHGKKNHLQEVWKFFCGLVDDVSPFQRLAVLTQSKENDLFMIKCAFESQQSTPCSSLVQSNEGSLHLKGTLTSSDFIAFSYVMNNTTFPVERLLLRKCDFREEGINILVNEVGTKLEFIKSLCFHYKNCGKTQMISLNILLNKLKNWILLT